MKTRLPPNITTAATLLSLVAMAPAGITFRTVALTGQQAPGVAAGQKFRTNPAFGEAFINQAGQVAFASRVTAAGASLDTGSTDGIWAGAIGGLKLAALEGNPAAIGSTFTISSVVSQPSFNDNGQVAFRAQIDGPTVDFYTNANTIWAGSPGGLQLVARAGFPAPGAGGATLSAFYSDPILGPNGRITFRASLSGTGVTSANNDAVWGGGIGAVVLLARTGTPAPGTGGATWSALRAPLVNASGVATLKADLAGPGVSYYQNGTGIWVGKPGALVLAARAGAQAPGVAAGQVFSTFGQESPAINASGEIAIMAELTGAGLSGYNYYGLWAGKTGSLKLAARGGQQAPGAEAGAQFGVFTSAPLINRAGQIAFKANLSGVFPYGTGSGIWAGTPGALRQIARLGKQAPGTPAGVVFSSFGGYMMNGVGQVVFTAGLSGGDVQPATSSGIWTTLPTGGLQLVARTGSNFQVPGGTVRTIQYINSFLPNTGGGQDGRAGFLNDAGQLALHLSFTDGTQGIFQATIPTSPFAPNGNDFNLDKKPDLLLFNPTTRATTAWYMNGAVLSGQAARPTLGAGNTLRGTTDFNRDGKADYLVYNPTTRQPQHWHLNGATVASTANGPVLPAGHDLLGTADFNLDDKPDYLLMNTATRQLSVWHLNGAAYTSTKAGPVLPAGWAVKAICDFDGNRWPDLVVYNASTLQSQIWYISGAVVASKATGPVLAAGWSPEGAADMNADGKTDLILHKPATRQTAVWHMNGSAFASSVNGPTLPSGFVLAAP